MRVATAMEANCGNGLCGSATMTTTAVRRSSSPSTGEYEIDLLAGALRAFEPPDPIAHRQICVVASSVLGRVGLDLMLAIAAPDNKPCLRRGCATERCWRPGVPVHRWRCRCGSGNGSAGLAGASLARIAFNGASGGDSG